MFSRRLATMLVAALLLTAPSGALAQTAGDEQYEDPFAGEPAPAGSEEQGELSEEAPGLGETPPPSTGGDGGEPAATGKEGEDLTAGGTELPATGGETGLIGVLGVGMLLTGAGLRLRLQAGART